MASILGLPAKFAEGSSEPLWDINTRYSSFMPWLNQEINFTVRFEDLIGPKGGGDSHTQISTLTGVADHLGLKLSSKKILQVADRLYNPKSLTFRKGRIGGWKAMFNDEHKKVFKKLAGELLIELGYEKDMDW